MSREFAPDPWPRRGERGRGPDEAFRTVGFSQEPQKLGEKSTRDVRKIGLRWPPLREIAVHGDWVGSAGIRERAPAPTHRPFHMASMVIRSGTWGLSPSDRPGRNVVCVLRLQSTGERYQPGAPAPRLRRLPGQVDPVLSRDRRPAAPSPARINHRRRRPQGGDRYGVAADSAESVKQRF
jgi:hypothetical protein